MKPYVLQEWSGRGEFLGCEAFDTMPAVEKSLFLWIQMMASKGYELAPFPGGVVACKRDAWGRSQPEMMAIIEPQRPAVTGAAVAAVTRNMDVRAGSCVAPLHHPIRPSLIHN